jgi:hypothetical protein
VKQAAVLSALMLFLGATSTAQAHLAYRTKDNTLQARLHVQTMNLGHAKYVCRHGGHAHKRWACKAIEWLTAERTKTANALKPPVVRQYGPEWWVAKQIMAAETLGRESAGDPWPNCPDPYDGSNASWYSTVRCENNGSWLDSPGSYRCGLQFDPMWERRFGKLCP